MIHYAPGSTNTMHPVDGAASAGEEVAAADPAAAPEVPEAPAFFAQRRVRDGPKWEKGDDSDDYNGDKQKGGMDRAADAWMKGHWATK